MKLNPLLLIDYYKATHAEQYPKNITRLVSYYTPRMSRLGNDKQLVHFGLQYFIKEYLIEGFNENFFNRPKKEVLKEYAYYINNTLVDENNLLHKVEELYDLGYLPIEVYSLPEGTIVPMQIPCLAITNSHEGFAWLVNTIESLLSATLWHAQISASVGMWYRNIVNQWYDKTCDDLSHRDMALGDFSFRGQESLESAVISSAGFLTSFSLSATVPTGYFMEKYYGADIMRNTIVQGSVSTEHSVMCSNFAFDSDEITMVKRLLTETYPNTSFSMVSDSYDYWNMVTNILPQCKKEIMAHNGTIMVRGDSGNPVEIICGSDKFRNSIHYIDSIDKYDIMQYCLINKILLSKSKTCLMFLCKKKYYKVQVSSIQMSSLGFISYYNLTVDSIDKHIPTPEELGTVECLWNEFGGVVNRKGYKVLDSHIKAIYGDSITVQRCEEIYKRLEEKGFASCNVALGVGSFSMQCVEEDDVLKPFTRDTYSSAVKSTYCEINGEPVNIFKDPKTDTGHFKKSQRGCCVVYNEHDSLGYCDGKTWKEVVDSKGNLLDLVFKDGNMIKEQTINEIRELMWGEKY